MFTGFSVTNLLLLVVCMVISITIHEFMHAYVGYRLGDTTAFEHGRVSFNPLHHIDPIMTVVLPIITLVVFHAPILAAKPVPFDPDNVRYGEYGAALLALAGPLSNLVLAFIAALLLRVTYPSGLLADGLTLFMVLNVSLFVFNLLPIPPLDGSRVLYAFAPEPLQDLMRAIEPVGFFVIFALVFWGGVSGGLAHIENLVLNLLP